MPTRGSRVSVANANRIVTAIVRGTHSMAWDGRYNALMARWRALSIMYHDVVENGKYSASGFAGAGADLYKLDRQEFARHLEVIQRVIGRREVSLTFDDGGVSAYETVAGMLEQHSRRGHFFITTDWIGRPGFLN